MGNILNSLISVALEIECEHESPPFTCWRALPMMQRGGRLVKAAGGP